MRSRAESYAWGGDDGFTLVELLLAIVIMGVITVPLTSVVIGYLRNTDTTTARLLRSHDVQIASAYWAQDIASIGQRNAQRVLQPSIQQPAMTPSPDCEFTGTIATFAWDDFANAAVVTVAYRVTFDPVSVQCELHWVRSTSPATDVILVHHLDPAKSPKVTCFTSTGTSVLCTDVPTANEKVTLSLSLTDPGSPGGVWSAPDLIGYRRGSS
jgi:prepilin-type N-terminal cleavage/methylation domain-containing protein